MAQEVTEMGVACLFPGWDCEAVGDASFSLV